jgi:ABC-2 type transport system ATP-binding protein
MELSMDPVIATEHVTCRYGRHEALHDVTFTVQPGTIFALLGPNGAGKTTTLRVLMNILRATSGQATVLGVDARRLGPAQLQTIGYVSENQELPLWMTVAEFLAYCRPFYPAWDDALCASLVNDFQLPPRMRLGRLSRGMRVKAALISALAYRPRLLVLDEPFSGLDPVVRDDLIHGVLGRAGDEAWSVLISSHDLDDVERLVDHVGFLDAGRLVLCEPMSALQHRFRRLEITLAGDEPRAWRERAPGDWLGTTAAGRLVRTVATKYQPDETERVALDLFPGAHVEVAPMSLRETFVALARKTRTEHQEARQ